MKTSPLIFLAATFLVVAACTDRKAQEPAINEGQAAPAQVTNSNQNAEHPFAATCRAAEGRWDDQQQLCFVTEAVCSSSVGVWQPGTGCVLDTPEAECDASLGMVFENSKCVMRTVSPKAFEV